MLARVREVMPGREGKKLIQVAISLAAFNEASFGEQFNPQRPSVHAAPVVGATPRHTNDAPGRTAAKAPATGQSRRAHK